MANVGHSHVILTIRNTHIFSKKPSTQVEKLIRVSRKHYIVKTGTAQLPRIGFLFYLHVSSFHEVQALS